MSLHWQDGYVEVAKWEGMEVGLQVLCQFMHLAGAGQPCCTVGRGGGGGEASRVVQLGLGVGGCCAPFSQPRPVGCMRCKIKELNPGCTERNVAAIES